MHVHATNGGSGMRTNDRSQARERHWVCAQRLRERRQQLGLTQIDVVNTLHHQDVPLTNRTLSAMEHGHALDLGWLPDLATALRCTTTYLLGLTTDPQRWQPDPPANATPPAPAVSPASPAGNGDAGDHRGWILGPNVPDRRGTHR